MAWPPNAMPGGVHVLSLTEAKFATTDIVLPDNFTIELPPNWPHNKGVPKPLHWEVKNSLSFGKGCVIDLSSKGGPPPTPAKGRNGLPGDIGERGNDGERGRAGAIGISGADFTLVIEAWGNKGSLWIKTDGSNGGDGGEGGDGGKGGAGECRGLAGLDGGPHGGDGGNGGDGGPGGKGGDTARVVIELFMRPPRPRIEVAHCPDGCGGRYTPPLASDDGTITVFGQPGCGGSGARGGNGGDGGDGDNCGFLRADRRPGRPGLRGRDPENTEGTDARCFEGPSGRCRESELIEFQRQ